MTRDLCYIDGPFGELESHTGKAESGRCLRKRSRCYFTRIQKGSQKCRMAGQRLKMQIGIGNRRVCFKNTKT